MLIVSSSVKLRATAEISSDKPDNKQSMNPHLHKVQESHAGQLNMH